MSLKAFIKIFFLSIITSLDLVKNLRSRNNARVERMSISLPTFFVIQSLFQIQFYKSILKLRSTKQGSPKKNIFEDIFKDDIEFYIYCL